MVPFNSGDIYLKFFYTYSILIILMITNNSFFLNFIFRSPERKCNFTESQLKKCSAFLSWAPFSAFPPPPISHHGGRRST